MENTPIIDLPVILEEQEGSLLCWAAVAVAISKYYNPEQLISQKALATAIFGAHNYNNVLGPSKALAFTGNLKAAVAGPLSLEEVMEELQQGFPIAACMRYFIGWHLVIIHGFSPAGELLIADSLHGPSHMRIDSFSTAYHTHYSWTHSYLTRAQPDTFELLPRYGASQNDCQPLP
jgi:hypothetical protein